MKDCSECHSPIPMQANLSFRKTSNPSRNTPTDHLIHHLINHLNHLINHQNHLNQIGLEDFSQSWQSNTALFWKHHGKLGADLDSKAEVLQSSSVLLTSIQAKAVSNQVSDVIDRSIALSPMDVKCHINQNPAQPVPGSRFPDSRSCFILLPNHWKELHSVQFSLVYKI